MRSIITCSSLSFWIIILLHNLNNSSQKTVPTSLPKLYCSLFSAKNGGSSQPKDTGAEMCIRRRMIEQKQRFRVTPGGIKCFIENQEHIHIIWLRFGRYKGAKDYHSS